MRIRYSPQAREDLEQIRRYIGGVLKNPDAARRVTAGIVADARKLSAQPMLGVSLQEKTGRKTEARVLVSGHYWIVYEVTDCVSVLRILGTRRDYFLNLGSW